MYEAKLQLHMFVLDFSGTWRDSLFAKRKLALNLQFDINFKRRKVFFFIIQYKKLVSTERKKGELNISTNLCQQFMMSIALAHTYSTR